MQAPSRNEAEAWLEGSSRYEQQRKGAESPVYKDYDEENSENQEALEEGSEEYQEEDEEEIDEEEEDQEEEEEEEEQGQSEEPQEGQNQRPSAAENRNQEGNRGNLSSREQRHSTKNDARLPYGSPVKRAQTTTTESDHKRHTSRVMMTQRDKSPYDANKYTSDRALFERLTGKSLSPTKTPEEFHGYYEKACKGFLVKKEEELEKKRRQKEEEELSQLQAKPTLISRPQTRPYVPLLDRTPLLDARRERELEKIKQEKEEKLQKELEELTFTPKINPRSKNLATNSPTRERMMNAYLRSRGQLSHSPLPQKKGETFQPKINPNSRSIVAMRENASKDVVERLYQKADLGKVKKNELAKKLTPKFTPSLNKNTRKIAKQIEQNYYNEHSNTDRQQSGNKRADKRKRSDVEASQSGQPGYREESHLDQASDLELLDILKQFNSMLEQKHETPINLHQLSSLMSTYSGKKKPNTGAETGHFTRESTQGQGEYREEEEDQTIHRQANTDRPLRSYPPTAAEEESNPMANIEKNLMHIQGSLQDLKENESRPSESLNALHRSAATHEGYLQSSSQSPNKKVGKTKKNNEHSRVEAESSEEIPSKTSITMNGEKIGKTQTPSKYDGKASEEGKSLASNTKSAKNDDHSSPAVQKSSKKKSQTTTKKSKKVKTYTDQSPRFDNESQGFNKSAKDARSLNEVFSHTLGSKNSLEGWNSNVEMQDYVEERMLPNQHQPEERVKGHATEHSFGGYSKEANETSQEEHNYRSNYPQEKGKQKESSAKKSILDNVQEKSRSHQVIKEQGRAENSLNEISGRGKANSHTHLNGDKNQTSQSNVSSRNRISESRGQIQERTPEKSSKGTKQENKKDTRSSTNSKDQNRRNMQDEKKNKAGSDANQNQDEKSKTRGSRKVSFEMPSDSRRSSIYEETPEGQARKKAHDQPHHSEKTSTFANKASNRYHEQDRRGSDDEASIQDLQKVRSGDYMSFSANTLDQQHSFEEHQPPQVERKLMEEYESDGIHGYIQTSPNRNRVQFDVVTTETIQIEPQSAPRFSFSMDGADKTVTSASSSGLKAMAEQIVKKFKAYDAQIKQTAREYRMSVSPPRTASPSPEHHENAQESSAKKDQKVFKSVEKSGLPKASKTDTKVSKPSKNSIPGSLSSVQSGVDKRLAKK